MIALLKKTTIKWASAALVLIILAGCSSLHNPIGSKAAGLNQGENGATGQGDVAATSAPPEVSKASDSTPDTSPESTDKASSSSANEPAATSTPAASPADSDSIIYKNTDYGFEFTLPGSWEGYTIIEDQWEGLSVAESGEKVTQTGPVISIRHPKWTQSVPRQDIPIMVFTIEQWDSLQRDEFHIGAAPVGPTELGRSGSYVFAIPARYNFAFPEGYEEVEKILEGKPLKAQ